MGCDFKMIKIKLNVVKELSNLSNIRPWHFLLSIN
jgi:hypothetical protein